jgi:hypothetical protein
MELEPEMRALRAIVRALEPLSGTARRRVVGYLYDALNPKPESLASSGSFLASEESTG